MTEHQLTCGIEIHQQLSTKKLFCSCESELVEEEGATLLRRLRPSQSELGEIDRAVLAQAARKMSFRYQAPPSRCCLVEADEEPPHDADRDAVQASLIVSALLRARPVDEVHYMRKIVIDGSNTSGFQRTALISTDGVLEVNGKQISILSVCLEEDAARKVETKANEVTYRLDRLGIPLIEIATGPDMHDGEMVRDVAQRLGSILRATKKVKRGLGTIREDVNISIPGGARVEIKGVQDLKLLPTYVEKEVERQGSLLKIRDMLRERGVTQVSGEVMDYTAIFASSKSKVITSALAKSGRVLGIKLPGFVGVMKSQDGRLRLGAEMAQHARTRGVMGIFHSDELPGYGITPETVGELRDAMGLGEEDAFAICADDAAKADAALRAVAERARTALDGVPEETRDPQPDGGSAFSRPLPGAGRMYPETDVRPIPISPERMAEIGANLPELPEQTINRFVTAYGIHKQQAAQIVREGFEQLFEELAGRDQAGVAARTFLNTYPELEKEGVDVSSITDTSVRELFDALAKGKFTKEALPDLLRHVAEGKGVKASIDALGITQVDSGEASAIISKLVREREHFVREKKMGAIGPLMAPAMAELRGKVDGKTISEILKKEIEKLLST
ncbi:MAG TPA: Glu-tRNA(Gln) amidotransferase subunit GatE [Methanomassiliicoccales archaeon]|jgi:glutamyl-tRNA(Gln) amidotransferase subunit E